MREVAVHGQGTSQEGGPASPPPQAGVSLPGDRGDGASSLPRGFSTQVGSSRVRDPRPASPQAGPILRCNNCGELGHKPNHCPNYGFYYPAPGKTREDYEEDRQRVQDLFAADIIHEHEVHEDDPEHSVFRGTRPSAEHKTQALQLICPFCGQGQGQKCMTEAGEYCDPHKSRLDLVDLGPPG